MTILLEIHINAAITGLKHQRHMETEFPCAVEQAALLLCKGFLSVIVHEYIYSFLRVYCFVIHCAVLAPLRTRCDLIGV